MDTESDLYYYRARYYNPQAGRFLSQDPIGFAAGDTNLYRYVFNNPVNLTDPTGLEVDFGGYTVSNPHVRDSLQSINNAIVSQGYPDNSFTIRVTGGDSYISSGGVVRSATNGQPIVDSFGNSRSTNSAHNFENGARAVDVSFSGLPSTDTFGSAVGNSNFIPGSLNYSDGYNHLRLPRQFSNSTSPRVNSCGN